MIIEYINEALKRAKYKLIENKEPFYGEVTGLKGVWATGKTLNECQNRLSEVLDGWIAVHLKKGLRIPSLGRYRIIPPKELSIRG